MRRASRRSALARRGLAALALAGLAACSSGTLREQQSGEASVIRLAGILGDALRGRDRDPAPFTVTRAQLAAAGVTQPFLVARLESGVTAGLLPAAANRGFIVWQTEDGIALLDRGGVLAGTKGLGGDLLSAETETLVRLLAAGREGRYRRVLRRLGGEGLVARQPYDCTLAQGEATVVTVLGRRHATRRHVETCRPLEEAAPTVAPAFRPEPFTNEYHVGDGTIWVSRQWVGPAVGYLRLERVIE